MRSLLIALPARTTLTLTPTLLLALAAAMVAALLLTFYVRLLHEAVDRRATAGGRTLAVAPTGPGAIPATPVALGNARR